MKIERIVFFIDIDFWLLCEKALYHWDLVKAESEIAKVQQSIQ